MAAERGISKHAPPTPDDGHARPPAVVLLSGGIDSATCLAVARRDGFRGHALSFDYGQRHRAELHAAARIARHLDAAEHRIVRVDLRSIGGSALTGDIDMPRDRTADERARGIPATYVPARNLIFLSLAAAFAEVVGARDIFIGVNAVDYSGYPDCRRPFIDAFEQTATLGTKAGSEWRGEGPALRVRTPLAELSKSRIIQLARELGVDLGLTLSCYDPDAAGRPCRRCDSCLIRRRGFEEAGVAES